MCNNIAFAHSSKERRGSPISSLTATYEKLLDVNSYSKGVGVCLEQVEEWWWYMKITHEGYEGRKCNSRLVPCGCNLLQNLHVVALVMCPANTESLLDFYLNRCYVDCPSNCLPLIIVQLQVFAINQTFRLHYQTDVSLSVSVCVSVSLSLYLSICLQCVIIFARNDQ